MCNRIYDIWIVTCSCNRYLRKKPRKENKNVKELYFHVWFIIKNINEYQIKYKSFFLFYSWYEHMKKNEVKIERNEVKVEMNKVKLQINGPICKVPIQLKIF